MCSRALDKFHLSCVWPLCSSNRTAVRTSGGCTVFALDGIYFLASGLDWAGLDGWATFVGGARTQHVWHPFASVLCVENPACFLFFRSLTFPHPFLA